jgi:hypothetical protein
LPRSAFSTRERAFINSSNSFLSPLRAAISRRSSVCALAPHVVRTALLPPKNPRQRRSARRGASRQVDLAIRSDMYMLTTEDASF